MPAFSDADNFGLLCPHCAKSSIAHVGGSLITEQTYVQATANTQAYHKDDERVVLVKCSECQQPVLIQQTNPAFWWETSSILWPPPDRPISLAVPDPIRQTCEEARGCFRHGFFRASVVMVRRALEGVCRDQGSTKSTLAASLADLEGQSNDRYLWIGLMEGGVPSRWIDRSSR